MSNISRAEERVLVEEAMAGDRQAFESLLRPHVRPLRSFLYRMIAHPEDAQDLAQETALRAQQKLATFRGTSSFRTWLFSIGSRLCLDLLRARKRWPVEAQIEGEKTALASTALMQSLDEIVREDDFRFEYRQHVAYCFSCVARSLPPEESAALLLREVYLFDAPAAAKVLGMSASTFRHRLSAARETMKTRFEGYCALVGKQGVCYQCAALRDHCPEEHRGGAPEPIAPADAPADDKLRRRLRVVRDADLEAGPGHEVHELLFRFMSDLWERPRGESAPLATDRRRVASGRGA